MAWFHTFKIAYSKASKNKIKSVPWVRVGSIELQPKHWVISSNGRLAKGWGHLFIHCSKEPANSAAQSTKSSYVVIMYKETR